MSLPLFFRKRITTESQTGRRWRPSGRIVRLYLFVSASVLAAWPAAALADPARPFWHPGPPWAPLACHSNEMCEISNLFWIMLVISGIVFLGVGGALVVSIFKFSAKPGMPEPTQVFGNRRVEVLWTLIPTFLLAVAFVIAVKAINDINSSKGHATFAINVVGHQWWWEFQYPKQNFVTADEVHIPAGQFVEYHVRSADVIHSFWAPQLQRQIDANPGIDNIVFLKTNDPGIYSGACYEYCGAAHAWMKFRTVVNNPTQFKAWVKAQQSPAQTPKTPLQKQGLAVFLSDTCANCHAIYGTSAGGAVGPNLTHLASRWAVAGGILPISSSTLTEWIRNPSQYKSGVRMPPFPTISQRDMKALVAYLISLK